MGLLFKQITQTRNYIYRYLQNDVFLILVEDSQNYLRVGKRQSIVEAQSLRNDGCVWPPEGRAGRPLIRINRFDQAD